jgi:hypothetical protein
MTKMLHDVELSLGDVSIISGIHANTLSLWAARGLLRPSNNAHGSGNHRRFGLVAAVAVCVAAGYRKLRIGPRWASGAARHIMGLSLEQLGRALATRNIYPVPLDVKLTTWALVPLPSCAPPGHRNVLRLLTVDTALQQVRMGIQALAKLPPNRMGRNRALAEVGKQNGHR